MADGDGWSACAFPGRFRRSQLLALAAVDDLRAAGGNRVCLALPPGAGKTVVGLEIARRLGRRTLVLAPTPVVQAQWLAAWAAFGPPGERHPVPAGTDRGLSMPVTVLTVDELHLPLGGLAGRTSAQPWTLVLDDCFLRDADRDASAAVADALGADAWVVGLTSAEQPQPPTDGSRSALFGGCDVGVPLAAAVQDGELAPFQDLIHVVTSTDDDLEGPAGKASAAGLILRAELAELGDDLRAAVVCDRDLARPGPPLPGRPKETSAREAFAALAGSAAGSALRPVLLTGRTVALRRVDVPAFRSSTAVRAAGLQDRLVAAPLDGVRALARLDAGPGWSAGQWAPLVTAWLQEGGTRCVVGTRGLLGTGWDCPSLNVLVDLTTTTAHAQAARVRGRVLRVDPARPGKVADIWTVVCVADEQPDGAADYLRAARLHEAYPAPSGTGELETGIGHCDPQLRPDQVPGAPDRDAVNAAALARVAARAAARATWRVGGQRRGVLLPTLQVRVPGDLGLPAGLVEPALVRPSSVFGAAGTGGLPLPRPLRPAHRWPVPVGGGALAAGAGLAASAPAGLTAGAATTVLLWAGLAAGRYRRQSTGLRLPADARTTALRQQAAAVADALHGCGLTEAGVDALQVRPAGDGWTTCLLDAGRQDAARFAAALEELLSPLEDPRWLVSRLVPPVPTSARDRRRLAVAAATGRPVAVPVAWQAVPAELSRVRERLAVFETAWWKNVGPGRLLRATEPEGQALLGQLRGADPFGVTARLRTVWR